MKTFNIEKSILTNSECFLTIDIGVSTIKCFYLDKENDHYNENSQNNDVIFTLKSTNFNIQIENFLQNIKSNLSTLETIETKLILICGIQCKHFQSEISKVFGCEVKVVSEMTAFANGVRYFVNHHERDTFYHQAENISDTPAKFQSKMREQLLKSWKAKRELLLKDSTSEEYPCLYVNGGSSCRYILVDEYGKGKEVSFNSYGGSTFQGLAKCLIDENNTSKLLEMAEVGFKENTDTQIKDIFDDFKNNPYGKFSPNMPLFAYGKATDYTSVDQIPFKDEDISQSLVSMVIQNSILSANRIAFTTLCKKIYIGGYLFQHKSFLVEYSKFCVRLPGIIKIHFLKCGFEANLGLLVNHNQTE